jgi:hypothetical protein
MEEKIIILNLLNKEIEKIKEEIKLIRKEIKKERKFLIQYSDGSQELVNQSDVEIVDDVELIKRFNG